MTMFSNLRRMAVVVGLAVLAVACAGDAPRPTLDPALVPTPRASVDVPYYSPRTPSGAITATAAVLDYYQRPLPDARLALIEADPTRTLPGAVTEAVWETGLNAWLLASAESVLAQVEAGYPVIVRLRQPDDEVYYVVLVGYDLDDGVALVHGPDGRAAPMPLNDFVDAWYSGGWSLAVLPPGEEPLIVARAR